MGTKVDPFQVAVHPNFVHQKKKESNDICPSNTNPLEPFAGLIRKCGFLGFPLKLSDLNLVPFSSKGYLKFFPLCSFFLIVCSLQMAMFFFLFLGEVNFQNVINWFKKEGFSTVDLFAFFFVFVPQGTGLVKQHNNLLGVSSQWNKLNKFFGKSLSQGVYSKFNYFDKR